MHPDIYDAGEGNTWNGHRYWLKIDPYPNENAAYENPSMLVSEDGETWTVPAGLTNPLVSGGSNVDGCLVVDGDGVMWLLYGTNYTYWKVISSTDGIAWSTPTNLWNYSDETDSISPSLVRDGSQYVMFAMNRHQGFAENCIIRRTAPAITGPWSDPVYLRVGVPPGREYLWHLDIIAADGVLYGLFDYDGRYFYFAVSEDGGQTWHIGQNPIIQNGSAGQWDLIDYRATIARTATGFDMWYSAKNSLHAPIVTRIGKTSISW